MRVRVDLQDSLSSFNMRKLLGHEFKLAHHKTFGRFFGVCMVCHRGTDRKGWLVGASWPTSFKVEVVSHLYERNGPVCSSKLAYPYCDDRRNPDPKVDRTECPLYA